MINKFLEFALILPEDVWESVDDFEKDFSVFLSTKNLEGHRLGSVGKLVIEVVDKDSSTVVPKEDEEPQIILNQILELAKKSGKPRLKVFRDSIN